MTSSLADIRTAIKATVSQFGLQAYDRVPDVANTPACVVDIAQNPSIRFSTAMAMGGDQYHFDLLILVANTDSRNAQQVLDEYVTGRGPKSIREFLFSNSGLGLPDVDCMPEKVIGYGGSPEVAGIRMIGAVMRVCVTVD